MQTAPTKYLMLRNRSALLFPGFVGGFAWREFRLDGAICYLATQPFSTSDDATPTAAADEDFNSRQL